MKIEQLVSLGVRLFAIFMFFSVIYNMGIVLIGMIAEPGSAVMLVGSTAVFILLITAIAAMWHHPERIAEKIIPRETGNTVSVPLDGEKVEKLLFTLLGLWVALSASADLVRDLFIYWQQTRFSGPAGNFSWPSNFWAVRAQGSALADGVKLLLGLLLIARARGCFKCCKSKCGV